jgi:hypothetical protein
MARAGSPVSSGGHGAKVLFFVIGFGVGVMATIAVVLTIPFLFSGPIPTVEVDAPVEVELGVSFPVTVRITNPHEEQLGIDNIDIPNEVLEGLEIVSVVPSAMDDSPDDSFGSTTWYFDITIPPAATSEVELTMRATEPGRHVLELSVCNS